MENISFKDFQKLDIRIGTIIEVEVPKDDEETPPVTFSLDKKVPNGTRVH